MKAVVTGMIGTCSVGGVAWDYGQYALGMEQLGFETYYLEDTGIPAHTWNEATGEYEEDPSYGLDFLQRALRELSPGLASHWHFHAYDDRTYGMSPEEVADVCASADVLLNVSGCAVMRDSYRRCRRKVFIDTDPGWNHFVIFPRWDGKPRDVQQQGYRGHDWFFTFAQRHDRPDCLLPALGLEWHPTRHPVVVDRWRPEPPGERWTTVMGWKTYPDGVEHNGLVYGSKEMEFPLIEAAPTRLAVPLEVAVNGDAPRQAWRELGWQVANGGERSATAESYHAYVQGSRGELSVAKNVYVATRSGWFSGRSACYLASGRPAVVQETGFSEFLPTGWGLLSFRDLETAVAAIEAVESQYKEHQQAAREIAETWLDARRVLGEILAVTGL